MKDTVDHIVDSTLATILIIGALICLLAAVAFL